MIVTKKEHVLSSIPFKRLSCKKERVKRKMRDHSFNEHQFFMIYHEYAESAIFIDDFMHAQQRHLDLLRLQFHATAALVY